MATRTRRQNAPANGTPASSHYPESGPLPVQAVTELPLAALPPATLRLDLGCGGNKKQAGPGEAPWVGVDSIAFPGVDVVADLTKPWPWADSSVAEAHASHFVEHLTAQERVHFVNELYRVLVPGGKATVITPHWASCRAYGDPTHRWPPVSEFWFYYLRREWRLGDPAKGLAPNAPHTDASHWPGGFNCDFDAVWGYGMRQDLLARNEEFRQFAMANYKEAITDIHCTLTCRK